MKAINWFRTFSIESLVHWGRQYAAQPFYYPQAPRRAWAKVCAERGLNPLMLSTPQEAWPEGWRHYRQNPWFLKAQF